LAKDGTKIKKSQGNAENKIMASRDPEAANAEAMLKLRFNKLVQENLRQLNQISQQSTGTNVPRDIRPFQAVPQDTSLAVDQARGAFSNSGSGLSSSRSKSADKLYERAMGGDIPKYENGGGIIGKVKDLIHYSDSIGRLEQESSRLWFLDQYDRRQKWLKKGSKDYFNDQIKDYQHPAPSILGSKVTPKNLNLRYRGDIENLKNIPKYQGGGNIGNPVNRYAAGDSQGLLNAISGINYTQPPGTKLGYNSSASPFVNPALSGIPQVSAPRYLGRENISVNNGSSVPYDTINPQPLNRDSIINSIAYPPKRRDDIITRGKFPQGSYVQEPLDDVLNSITYPDQPVQGSLESALPFISPFPTGLENSGATDNTGVQLDPRLLGVASSPDSIPTITQDQLDATTGKPKVKSRKSKKASSTSSGIDPSNPNNSIPNLLSTAGMEETSTIATGLPTVISSPPTAPELQNTNPQGSFRSKVRNALNKGLAKQGDGNFPIGEILQLPGIASRFMGISAVERETPNLLPNRQIDPSSSLRQLRSTLNAQTRGINTGNLNTNRALRQQSFADLNRATTNVLSQTSQQNAALTQQTRQANIQEAARVAQVNAQNRAARDQAKSAAFDSLGNLGRGINKKRTNKKAVQSLLASFPDIAPYLSKELNL
jgi:hypothetical protein